MRLISLFLILTLWLAPQVNAKDSDCFEKSGEVQLKSCTHIIKNKRLHRKRISKKNLSIVYYNRGNAHFDKRLYDLAKEDYRQAITLNKKLTLAHFNIGSIHHQNGQYLDAISDFTQVIRLKPKHASAYNYRGLAYKALGQNQKAIANFDKSISLEINNPKAYNNRGLAYKALGFYDQSIYDFTESIRLNPRIGDTYNNRGNSYFLKDEYDKAISDYKKAIRINPKIATAYNNLAMVYNVKSLDELAIENMKKAISLNPNNQKYKERLNKLLASRHVNKIDETQDTSEVPKEQQGQRTKPENVNEAELEFWKSVRDTKDPAELEAYINAYPNGQFSTLAKLRLKKLK